MSESGIRKSQDEIAKKDSSTRKRPLFVNPQRPMRPSTIAAAIAYLIVKYCVI